MLKSRLFLVALCLLPAIAWPAIARAAGVSAVAAAVVSPPSFVASSAPTGVLSATAAGPESGASLHAAMRVRERRNAPPAGYSAPPSGHPARQGRAVPPSSYGPGYGSGGFPGDPSGRGFVPLPGQGLYPSPAPRAASPGRSILDGRAIPGPYSQPESSLSGRRPRLNVPPGASSGSFPGGAAGAKTGAAPVATPRFDRTLHACLYRDNRWLLPEQPEYPVGQALASLAPTFVTGAMRVTANTTPDRQTVINWAGLRRAVRGRANDTAFDIVLDLRQYDRPNALAAHMAAVATLLDAEAWTLLGCAEAARRRPELLRAAIDEAHRQGRAVGALTEDGRPPAAGLEYLLVPYEHGGRLPARRAAGSGKAGPPVIVVTGSAQGPPGSGFAREITPAQRRIMVMRAAKAQKNGLFLAYPVFGPMAGPDQAYNALRDEFMFDTVRRGLENGPK